MIRFEAEATIERSADEIWAFAADVARHTSWMNVLDARVVEGRPTERGARAVETMRLGPRRLAVEFEVSAAEPGRRIAWRVVRGGPFRAEVRLDLQPLGPTSTRAHYAGEFELTGAWRLLEPFMAGEFRSGERAELGRLKAAVERQATATAMTAT